MPNNKTPYGRAKAILSDICSDHGHDLDYYDAKEALETMGMTLSVDFNLDLDGAEYRIVSGMEIGEVYEDAIKEIVLDCYELNLPSFFDDSCINWDQVANNCLADGYGHTLSTYDGSESEIEGFYIFRTG